MRNKLTKRGLQYRIRMFERAVKKLTIVPYSVRFKSEVEKWRKAIIAASYYER